MRYLILVILNLPVILLAFTNLLTQYKLKKISKVRFRRQILLWLIILIVLVSSFPLYNYFNGKHLFDSSELSFFDIAETTAIIFLFYVINRHRQQIDQNDKIIRDLHQEISIKLATNSADNTSKKS